MWRLVRDYLMAQLFRIDYPEVGEIQGDYVKSIQKAI